VHSERGQLRSVFFLDMQLQIVRHVKDVQAVVITDLSHYKNKKSIKIIIANCVPRWQFLI
jgi:hypothetical protein